MSAEKIKGLALIISVCSVMRLIEVNVWSNGNNTVRVDGFVTLLDKYNTAKFMYSSSPGDSTW